MYNKQKDILLCLVLVGVWILDFLSPSLIVNLNSALTGVQLYNEGEGGTSREGSTPQPSIVRAKVIVSVVLL